MKRFLTKIYSSNNVYNLQYPVADDDVTPVLM